MYMSMCVYNMCIERMVPEGRDPEVPTLHLTRHTISSVFYAAVSPIFEQR